MTPYLNLYGRQFPLYNKLKVVAGKALIRVSVEHRNKLDQQATEVTFMGFDKDFAYIFFYKTNKMTKALDVIYYEDQFFGDRHYQFSNCCRQI